jgi:hypothetical protein
LRIPFYYARSTPPLPNTIKPLNSKYILMISKRNKLIVCRSLAHFLDSLTGPETEVRVLDIGLHVDPQRLRARLIKEVGDIEEEDTNILLGYGLCGRALEGVVSSKSTLVLPRVDDCVGALLGSRERHKKFLKQNAGCYFIHQNWLNTELNVFSEILKGLERVPREKRKAIVKIMLKNYRTLALLYSDDPSPESESLCLAYAKQYDLNLIKVETEPGLLTRLIKGPWREDEFLVLPPGRPVPFF